MKSHLLKSIGILVFAWILWKIDRNALIANLKGANFLMIIGAFLIHYIVFYFKSVRWHIFVSSTGLKTSMYQSWKLCNIGLFLSCITPAKIGEFGKSAYLISAGISKAQAIGIVILDRIMDVITIGIIAIAGIGILFGLQVMLTALIIGGMILLISVVLIQKFSFMKSLLIFLGFNKFLPSIDTLIKTLAVTMLAWSFYFVLAVLVARSLGIDTPIYILVAAFTVTGIVSLIPIAPAGLGTRDAALMWLLSGYGVEAHQAIALSFIMFVCLILSNMLGMTYFLSNKRANLFNEGYTKIT